MEESEFLVIIQFRYLYRLSIRHNKVRTSLRRRYPTSLWSFHLVVMETLDDVAFATLSDVSIATMVTSERRLISTSQQPCNTSLCLPELMQRLSRFFECGFEVKLYRDQSGLYKHRFVNRWLIFILLNIFFILTTQLLINY